MVLVALTACSGDNNGAPDPAVVVHEAFEATVAAGTARVELTITTTASVDEARPSSTQIRRGVVDFANRAARVDIVADDGSSTELRVIGATAYVEVSGVGERPWLRASLAQLAGIQDAEVDPDAVDLVGGLDYLRCVTNDVERIDDTTLNNRPATRYRAILNRPGQLHSIGALVAPDESATTPPTAPSIEVWVDDNGRVARLRYDTTTQAIDEELSDFGTPASIAAPPHQQVSDIGDIQPEPTRPSFRS